MDSKPSDITINLKNGDKVKVNDHVYCSPNWSIRDGTPYSIARIMEFLPPEDKGDASVSGKGKGKSKESYTRVRLAWYYRPSDVSDRAVADARLLLAAIYSEICEISQLRAKCYVIHRDKLSNLSEWRKKPDHFYFHRLFDPYIKREFEVLLSTEVRNLPQHIRDVLISRYEYVVAEKEVVPDLTDSLRLCESCGEWCAHLDAVQCARCKNHFHMSCVSPPLVAKPARGYGWTCAPCSRRHEEKVDSGSTMHLASQAQPNRENTPKTGGSISAPVAGKPARGRGRPRKERPGMTPTFNEEELQVKHYKLWPFRYFGLYTVAEDTLDPDDLIFPRAATRIGPKYQANVPQSLEETTLTANSLSTSLSSGSGSYTLPSALAPSADVEERGGDSTIEVLSVVNQFTTFEVENLNTIMQKQAVRKDLLHSVDWLTEIVRRACNARTAGKSLEAVSMRTPMRPEKWKKHETRYTDREWNDQEVSAFEDGIRQFGAELRSVRDEVGTRSMPEVVRFYGKWKNARLREENARLREPDAYKKAKIPRSGAATPASTSGAGSDDEESSLVNVPATAQGYSRSSIYCAACRTRDSRVWWKAPKGLATAVLCDPCGVNWRKYADLNARPTTREETALNAAAANGTSATAPPGKGRGAEKREGTPLSAPLAKKAKTGASISSSAITPPPTQALTQYRCFSCFRQGPNGKVLKCQQCGVTLHSGACGAVVPPDRLDSWLCELCQNEQTLEASLNTDCLLCPHPSKTAKKSNPYPPADTYLRACKPTEGQGWVHVLCSVFIPDIQYADPDRLRLVEGISILPKHRWTTRCSLCGVEGGAVVRCGNCPKEYHVSCAWKIGHKFGFEIQPVKSSRRDITNTVTFKRESGAMNAVICCKEHSSYRRDLYDICDVNDAGETALQVYVRTYKQAPITQSHSLLRKARRLDQLLNATHGDNNSIFSEQPPVVDPKCVTCHTEFSPFFYPYTTAPGEWQCHRCHYESSKTVSELTKTVAISTM